jgi:DtxR family Mn-dependent transcriptional regulator
MRTKTIEEYIELIYNLEKKDGHAHTGTIASEMNIKPPSVTQMLQKLEKEGLVSYQSYTGTILTTQGKDLARQLMEKHRVIAEFLEMIGIDKKLAQRDACQIEHHMSKETIRHIEEVIRLIKDDPAIATWFEEFSQSYP